MKIRVRIPIMSALLLMISCTIAFSFTEPPYISVTKPTPSSVKIIDRNGGGDYLTIEAADNAYASLTKPVLYYLKEGTYNGTTWNSSGTLGNEIVFAPHPSNTLAVIIENTGSSTTMQVSGSHIIFDGGINRGIVIDGSKGTGDHYMVRLNEGEGHITFSRIHMRNAKGGTSGKGILPEINNIKIYNSIIENSDSVGIYIQNGSNIEVRNCIIRNNLGSGIQVNPHEESASCDNITISGNMVYRNGDGGPAGERPGITILSAANRLYDASIYNNYVWGNKTAGIKKEEGCSNANLRLYHNTLFGNIDRGLWIKTDGNVEIKNNLVYNNGSNSDENSAVDSSLIGASNISGNHFSDPQFVSENEQSSDFLTISRASPARITNTNLSHIIPIDIYGNSRIGSENPDAGAYEYTENSQNPNANQGPTCAIDTPENAVDIAQNETLSFSSTALDPDNNNPLTFLWTFGNGSAVSSVSQEDPGNIQFTTAGTYVVTLTVTDALGASATDSVTVTVTAAQSNSGGVAAAPSIPSNGIYVTPADSYGPIESAQAGALVLLAPGTYKFRVYLSNSGTTANPIVIRAADPDNPPVWDLDGKDCDEWPGSYTAGDLGRGAWQIEGSNITVSDIVIKNSNCNDGACFKNSAGIRHKGGDNITVRNAHIEGNDNGITGWGDNLLYEDSTIYANGNASEGDGTHNIYTHGGVYTFRRCHIYDPIEGQNVHSRSRDIRFEYCLIENGYNYTGDIMVNSNEYQAGSPNYQTMTFLGCTIKERQNPGNSSKVFTMYNQPASSNVHMRINMYYNTFIGNGQNEAMIRFTDSGLASQSAYLYNNIFYGNHIPFSFDTTTGVTAVARNNWWPQGYSYTSLNSYMSDSYFGSNPGFLDLAGGDYKLSSNAMARAKANTTLGTTPAAEFYVLSGNDFRSATRNSANDIGAFEYGSLRAPVLRIVSN